MPYCDSPLERSNEVKRDNVSPIVRAILPARQRLPCARRCAWSFYNRAQPPVVTTGMMATIQSGTAIILLVAGSQQACSVKPVATVWVVSLTIS